VTAARPRARAYARRREPERGAALIELALAGMLLFLLLFGVVEFAVSYDRFLGVRQASREGARQGVVGTLGSDDTCGINGDAVSANSSTKQLICLTKSRSGLGDDARVAITVPDYAQGEPMAICVQYELHSITGLFAPFLDGRVVQSDVQMRIEDPTADPVLETTSERSPRDGGDIPCEVS
jgi:hypothetical protein